jgi:Protein of unknown function (DUF2585)
VCSASAAAVTRQAAVLIVAIAALAAAVEWRMGRPLTYRHGPVRLWSGDVSSDQNSQQIADPYTFTHFEHGALFYGLTWLVMRGASLGTRSVAAIAIEAAWEAYENTDAVIERYRTETISLGYYGDSVINSLADIAACLFGFLLTWRLPRRVTVGWIVAVEVILALWIRDNLFLNILMLVRPVDAVRQWQMGATPSLGIRSARGSATRRIQLLRFEAC